MTRHQCLHGPGLLPLLAKVAALEGQRIARVRRRKKNPAPSVPTDLWAAPDSALCRAAAETCALHSSKALLGHCARTYAFGMALAAATDRKPDRELLYVASLLHDLGLTPAFDGDDPFELRGAEAAYAWCIEHDVEERHAELVHEAIRIHTSLEAEAREPEIALVHLGAGVDVIGYHLEDLDRSTVSAILDAWPRDGFKDEIVGLLGREAKKTPSSPLGVQWRIGFAKRVRATPF
ncbi:MAG: HD domain-containing protein [Deltaproteobacteria bacterium]